MKDVAPVKLSVFQGDAVVARVRRYLRAIDACLRETVGVDEKEEGDDEEDEGQRQETGEDQEKALEEGEHEPWVLLFGAVINEIGGAVLNFPSPQPSPRRRGSSKRALFTCSW